jgi:hypothetical protein
VVVHFEGKTVIPECIYTDYLFTKPLVNVTNLMHLGSHKQDIKEGPLTRELKLGG